MSRDLVRQWGRDAGRPPVATPTTSTPARRLVIKRRRYQPGDHAAAYAGPDPIAASRRLAETEVAARRTIEQSEEEQIS
jgi:hypothetical protein